MDVVRRAVVVVGALAVASSGCRTTGGKLGGTLAGTGAIAGLIANTVCSPDPDGQPGCHDADAVGYVIAAAIIGGVAIAIVSEATYEPPAPAPDQQAKQLTVEAHEAASSGQCASLPVLAQRVNALDADYYTRVFYVDPAIRHCMQAR
jgi:hypothetical protein